MRTLLERTRDELKKDIHWTKKAVVINVYHQLCVTENPKWSYSDTAHHLNTSRAYISEMIGLTKMLVDNPELVHMSRIKALEMMRSI